MEDYSVETRRMRLNLTAAREKATRDQFINNAIWFVTGGMLMAIFMSIIG